MLPIQTVEGVLNDMSTGSIIDLSEYLKKTEGVSKTELDDLKVVISNKLDAEPQHKHQIDDIKQLATELNSKFDRGERYSYNVILSDTEKISYLEAPKIELLELVKNKEAEGYKFYVDESNGDLMITLDGVLIGSYSIASGKWSWESNGNYADANHTHTKIDNALTVTGDITSKGSLNLNGTQSANAGPNIYMGSVEMRTAQNVLNTWIGRTLKHTINADGVKVNGNLTVTDSLTATPSQTKISSQETILNSSITTTGGQLDVGGTISSKGLTINSTDVTLAKLFTSADAGNIYFGKSTADGEGAFIEYNKTYNQVSLGLRGSGTRIYYNPSMTKVYGSLDVAGKIDVGSDITAVNVNATDVYTRYAVYFQRDNLLNDVGRIYMHGKDDNGFLEIATSDDAAEPIYVRQYQRAANGNIWSTIVREAALLDADGNTEFPGNLTAASIETSRLSVQGTDILAKIALLESDNASLRSKIAQMEAVLQNHYQALILLLEKHDMVDSDSTDGANITPGEANAAA